jgi:uncharacterized OB-fold protein
MTPGSDADAGKKLSIVQIDRPLAYPPRITELTKRFWGNLALGVLESTRCQDCQHLTFPPKGFCPKCWSKAVTWEVIAPEGKLYSWTRIHAGPAIFADELPYDVGVVDLDAGIRIACRLWSDEKLTDWQCEEVLQIIVMSSPNGVMFAAAPKDLTSI